MANFEFLTSTRGGQLLVVNNYMFRENVKTGGRTCWKLGKTALGESVLGETALGESGSHPLTHTHAQSPSPMDSSICLNYLSCQHSPSMLL